VRLKRQRQLFERFAPALLAIDRSVAASKDHQLVGHDDAVPSPEFRRSTVTVDVVMRLPAREIVIE